MNCFSPSFQQDAFLNQLVHSWQQHSFLLVVNSCVTHLSDERCVHHTFMIFKVSDPKIDDFFLKISTLSRQFC